MLLPTGNLKRNHLRRLQNNILPQEGSEIGPVVSVLGCCGMNSDNLHASCWGHDIQQVLSRQFSE